MITPTGLEQEKIELLADILDESISQFRRGMIALIQPSKLSNIDYPNPTIENLYAGIHSEVSEMKRTGKALPGWYRGIIISGKAKINGEEASVRVAISIFPTPYPSILIPEGKKPKKKANGYEYWTGGALERHEGKPNDYSYWIAYAGDDLGPLLTPKKLPKILEKLQKEVEREADKAPKKINRADYENPLWGMAEPIKAMGMLASTNFEESIPNYLKRLEKGARSNNPVGEIKYKGSSIAVYHEGKLLTPAGSANYPRNEGELRAYLASVFGPEGYLVLIGLVRLRKQINKRYYEVSLTELVRLIYGTKPKGQTKKKVWDIIRMFDNTRIEFTRPHGKEGKGKIEYPFNIVILSEKIYNKKNSEIPDKVLLELFPQKNGEKFKEMAIPGAVMDLSQKYLRLFFLLFLEVKHHGQHEIKIREAEIMEAAQLGNTYKSFPRQAKQKLKPKLKYIEENTGIIGPLIGFENGYAIISPNKGPELPQIEST